ncbi:nucleolar protein 6 [Asbolus verrucosus]|uniref:Nucleolar protein 6 n=1 Tax=Asbolus verrucosus TaxID=1661398 RepID=A0A482W624_ASBVE|nr:nucleolar protein 6 [Asbolus verrucosus]
MHLSDEEQNWGGDSSAESTDSEKPSTKGKPRGSSNTPLKRVKYEDITSERPNKKPKNELYKPPTVEELNELKETQNLYNNNLFRLQIEELVKEVKIKNKHQNAFAAWYQSFQSFLDELPEYDIPLSEIRLKNKKKLTDEQKFVNEIVSESIKCDQDFVMKFVKPEGVETFGLHKMNALAGPKLAVNINLKIPKACFNVKDYLNNRYFVKRYYFLAYVAYFLKTKDICGEIQWILHNNNRLLPIIQIKMKDSEKILIKLFATPTENYFKASRFLSDINNVKVNVFNSENITEAPTLFYNSSLAHDVTLTINNSFIEESLSELGNVQEAIKLIYIWLVQRELNVGLGSFTEDLVVYFMVYLVSKKKINKHMSSYQVIRNFWNFIDATDLTANPISICDDLKPEVLDNFRENFDVVFLDKTGCYNIASFLNLDVYKKIKSECAIAFKLLDDGGINSFHSLFITKLPKELQYDLILNIKSESNFENIIDRMDDDERTKFLGLPELFVVKNICNTLHRGLNKRALLIVPFLDSGKSKTVSFGVNLDPSHAFNFLEMGPAVNDSKEKEFREFWGDLSSDRRFKDGSVCVAVYFKTETTKGKREIIRIVVDWICSRKLNLEYKLHYDDFDDLLVNKKVTASYPMGTNEECCLKVIAASDDLGKKLRTLEMPLTITSVQGISDTFSFTETFPPIAMNFKCGNKITSALHNNIIINDKRLRVVPRYVKPVECVLQLEHSSKWPKDLDGIRHMKTAFYLEISKLLAKKHKIVSSVKPEVLDVLYGGYVFRYQLYLSREIGLLKKESTSNGAIVYKDTPESREMEKKLNILPKLTGALKGLQSQNPSFGPATALIKRWLRSHLIDNHHFPDVVINLLNASLYLNQSAFIAACTPQIGFLRFLKFFAELQYHIQPVVVNFNDGISKETITEIDSKLLQNREACPHLFIATPYDGCESLFTKAAPSKEVLRRVKQLASETLSCVTSMVREENLVKVRDLFVPNLEGFNVIIHLRPLLNPVRHEQVIGDELEGQVHLKAFNAEESTKVPVTDFNPVQLYLRDLRNNYGEFANFFHDTYGGNIIGVLWIPKALEEMEFKVSHVNGRKLVDNKLVLNIDSLIEDFYILGKGLVKSIDKR